MRIAFYMSLAFTALAVLASIWAANYAPLIESASSEMPQGISGEMPLAFGLAVNVVFLGLALNFVTGAIYAISALRHRATLRELA